VEILSPQTTFKPVMNLRLIIKADQALRTQIHQNAPHHAILSQGESSDQRLPEAYPEIWIRGREGVGSRPSPFRPLPSSSRPLPIPLEVGPLNPARGSGGAL